MPADRKNRSQNRTRLVTHIQIQPHVMAVSVGILCIIKCLIKMKTSRLYTGLTCHDYTLPGADIPRRARPIIPAEPHARIPRLGFRVKRQRFALNNYFNGRRTIHIVVFVRLGNQLVRVHNRRRHKITGLLVNTHKTDNRFSASRKTADRCILT